MVVGVLNIRNKYFVHFKSPEELDLFLKQTKMSIQYKCCRGLGACLKYANSEKQIEKLRSDFYKNNSNLLNNLKTFECPVCYEEYDIKRRYEINCGHDICKSCIKSIKKNNNLTDSCPICRNSL